MPAENILGEESQGISVMMKGLDVERTVVAAGPAGAQQATTNDSPLIGGFADHLVAAQGGCIDWTNGYILADGLGYAEGVDKQQELLAERAATTTPATPATAVGCGRPSAIPTA